MKGGDITSLPASCDMAFVAVDDLEGCYYVLKRPNKEGPKARTLEEILGVHTMVRTCFLVV